MKNRSLRSRGRHRYVFVYSIILVFCASLFICEDEAYAQNTKVGSKLETQINQAKKLYEDGQYTDALSLLGKIMPSAKRQKRKNISNYYDVLVLTAFCTSANSWEQQLQASQIEIGILAAEEALGLSEELSISIEERIELLFHLGSLYAYIQQWGKAEPPFTTAYELALNHYGHDSLKCRTLQEYLAWTYCLTNNPLKAHDVLVELVPWQLDNYDTQQLEGVLSSWYNQYCYRFAVKDELGELILRGLIHLEQSKINPNYATLSLYYYLISEFYSVFQNNEKSYESICLAEDNYILNDSLSLFDICLRKAWTQLLLNKIDDLQNTIDKLNTLSSDIPNAKDELSILELNRKLYMGKKLSKEDKQTLSLLMDRYSPDDSKILNILTLAAHYEDDPEAALSYLNYSLLYYDTASNPNPYRYGFILREIGYQYSFMGDHKTALQYLLQAIDVWENPGSLYDISNHNWEYADLLYYSARVAAEAENPGLSISLYEKLRVFHKEIHYDPWFYIELLRRYRDIRNNNAFYEVLNEAKEYISTSDPIYEIGITLYEVDDLLLQNRIDEALALFHKTEMLYDSLNKNPSGEYEKAYLKEISENMARFKYGFTNSTDNLFEFYSSEFSKSDYTPKQYDWLLYSLANILETNNDYLSSAFLLNKMGSSYHNDPSYYVRCFRQSIRNNELSKIIDLEPQIVNLLSRQQTVVIGLTDNEKESYYVRLRYLKDVLFSVQRNDTSDNLLKVSLLTKGFIHRNGIAMNNYLENCKDASIASLAKELRQTRRALDDETQIMSIYDSLRIRVIELNRELSLNLNKTPVDSIFPANHFESISSSLNNGDAAIEFVSYTDYISDEVYDKKYSAFIIKPEDEHPVYVELCTEKELEKLLQIPRKKLYDKNLPFSNELYSLILSPIRQHIIGAKRIIVSLDGVLSIIPIEALATDSGNYLCEELVVKRVSSLLDFVFNNEPINIEKAVVFGGLQYDTRSNDKDDLFTVASDYGYLQDRSSGGIIPYLPATKFEAEMVSRQLSNRGINNESYLGYLGSEDAFKSLSNSPTTLIHIATHGFYKPKDAIKKIAYYDNYNEMISNDAMHRSGLLLAECNDAWNGHPNPNQEDGVLTASEISGLDLSATKLIVLSACETGLGEISEDGIIGLQRAFKNAGVQSIIMSLWKVDDKATEVLMTSFYSLLLNGQTVEDAFSNAKLKLQKNKKYSNPYYWAAFIMLD